MLIQFHATLAASCNLRDIKGINGIAFFAYFDGTFSQRGIQFLIPTFVCNLCFECPDLQHSFFHLEDIVCIYRSSRTDRMPLRSWDCNLLCIRNITKQNIWIHKGRKLLRFKNICILKNSIIIGLFQWKLAAGHHTRKCRPLRVVPKQKPIIPGEIIRLGRHN